MGKTYCCLIILDGHRVCAGSHKIIYSLLSNDEQAINISCKLNLTNPRFKCLKTDKCILRQLLDGISQCEDNSDETFPIKCTELDDIGCQYPRGDELLLSSKFTSYINFHEYCNGFTHEYYFLKNETDETDCNELCLTDYTLCDGAWNSECEINEHYCFKLNINGAVDLTCLSIEQVNNDIIDCLDSYDERKYCRDQKVSLQLEAPMGFRCWNSNICIHAIKVCDGVTDCPSNDDEMICPWRNLKCLFTFNAVVCKETGVCQKRCTGKFACLHSDDEWLYDLDSNVKVNPFQIDYLSEYPRTVVRRPSSRKLSEILSVHGIIYCNRAILVESRYQLSSIYQNFKRQLCLCHDRWAGKLCDKKSRNDICASNSCDKGAMCVGTAVENSICICPLGHTGYSCPARYNPCKRIQCANQGHCLPFDDRILKYICVCSEDYFGDECQYSSAKVSIQFLHIDISAVVIHFVDQNSLNAFVHRKRFLYRNIQSNKYLSIVYEKELYFSSFIYVQIFVDSDHFYGTHYLLAFLPNKTKSIVTFVNELDRCPHVKELLKFTSSLNGIKLYHRMCHMNNKTLKCFQDDIYMCFCNSNRYADCLVFDHRTGNGSDNNECLNEGRCIDSAHNEIITMVSQYALTLDALVGTEIQIGVSLNNQKLIIKLTFTIVLFIVVIGLISNTLSFIAFSQSKTNENGCGFYLLCISIISRIILIVLAARFFYLLITQISIKQNCSIIYIGCMALEFMLTFFTHIFDWLTACITAERIAVVVGGTKFDKKRSKKISKPVVLILVLFIFTTTIHQLFFTRQLINDQYDRI
ncbi:unnamed protein product, partial [Didymodactylos carnosus]